MLEHACRLGLEGIISKRRDLPYRPGRGDHWFKAKCMSSQEFMILGYIPSTAASGAVGSLALGYHADGKLVYAGRVGTGWSEAQARSLRKELETISGTKPVWQNRCPPAPKKAWLGRAAPRLRGRISRLDPRRADPRASFKGLREDKPARKSCWRPRPRKSRDLSRARRADRELPIRSASCGRSRASPSRASPSSTPTSPIGFCRTSPGGC